MYVSLALVANEHCWAVHPAKVKSHNFHVSFKFQLAFDSIVKESLRALGVNFFMLFITSVLLSL